MHRVVLVLVLLSFSLGSGLRSCDLADLEKCHAETSAKRHLYYAFRSPALKGLEQQYNINVLKIGVTGGSVRSRYKEEYNKLISQCLVDGKFITIDKDDPTIASKGVNFASLKKDETKQQLRACVERKWLFLGKITCIASKECLDVLFACTLKYHGGTLGLIDWPMRGLSDFDNRYGSFYTSMSNYLPFLGGGITEIFIFNPADENDTNKRKGYIEGEGIKSHVKRLFERMVTLKFEGKDGKFDFSAYKCDVDDSNIDIFTTGEEKKETNKKRKDEGNPNEQKEKKKKE